MNLSIRAALAADAPDILEFLRAMHAEVGQAPLSDVKALNTIVQVCMSGAAFVVERDGEIVASMGLAPIDYWYSHDSFIGEVWLYVAPAFRAGGLALGMLLNEARELAKATMMTVMVDHYRARGARPAELSIVADRFNIRPQGQILMLSPQGGH